MSILKQDLQSFTKPMLVYLLSTQILWAISFNIGQYFGNRNEILISYFVVFIYVFVAVSTVAFTILWAIYFNTKSNLNHRQQYQLTDGYGLYRFIITIAFIVVLVLNFVTSLLVNDIITLRDLLQIEYHVYFGSLFFFIPIFALMIFSIAKMRNKPIFKNLVAILSFAAILIGLYIAGNLYYFNNSQQGVAILLLLFIPIAVLYNSFKDRDSQEKYYKLTIFSMCLIAVVSASILFITSDFKYDYSQQEPYTPEYYKGNIDISTELINTEYGELIYIADEQEYGDTYALTSDNFTYRINNFEDEFFTLNAYQLYNANQININMYSGLTEPEVISNIYDSDTNTHMSCVMPLSDAETDQECGIDQEVIAVYQMLEEIVEFDTVN